MSDWVEGFVERLAHVSLSSVFNPYADVCEAHDLPDAPEIRRRTLAAVLRRQHDLGVKSIWVGRDLGYKGGRRSGIALTDESHLARLGLSLGLGPLRVPTLTRQRAERTASVTWDLIERLPVVPVLWNAFPLHPHEPGNSMSNRLHSKREREITSWTLRALVKEFDVSEVVAIGNDASDALEGMGIRHTKVRHPSYGGQAEFTGKVAKLYGLHLPLPAAQLELI